MFIVNSWFFLNLIGLGQLFLILIQQFIRISQQGNNFLKTSWMFFSQSCKLKTAET